MGRNGRQEAGAAYMIICTLYDGAVQDDFVGHWEIFCVCICTYVHYTYGTGARFDYGTSAEVLEGSAELPASFAGWKLEWTRGRGGHAKRLCGPLNANPSGTSGEKGNRTLSAVVDSYGNSETGGKVYDKRSKVTPVASMGTD